MLKNNPNGLIYVASLLIRANRPRGFFLAQIKIDIVKFLKIIYKPSKLLNK
jgi:hypothetical protein